VGQSKKKHKPARRVVVLMKKRYWSLHPAPPQKPQRRRSCPKTMVSVWGLGASPAACR